jgi:hypothetical protein
MSFKSPLTTALLLICFSGYANVISVSTAQSIAVNFYQTNNPSVYSIPLSATLHMAQTESDGTVDFYVFDISPAPGFVIVSAADNVTPILAYSTESSFQTGYPQVGIRGWMEHTSSAIHQAVVQQVPAPARVSSLWAAYRQGQNPIASRSSVVSPMLATSWGQDPYYNILCPYDNVNHGRSVTGCVATTMAQIMKYWSFPQQGVGTYSYVDSEGTDGYSYNIGRLSADFGTTRYDWSGMKNSINAGDTSIGQLLYQCGVAVGMNYSATGSSAYFNNPGHACALSAFTSYFSYDASTIKYIAKGSYSSTDWMSLIENELNEGRPVFYTGQDTANIGGHAWVCDGYDASGNLHMNWGWGGMDNGYFNVTDLDAAPYNFSWSQSAIIGIHPDPAVQALGIEQVASAPGFDLYPNPARNRITIFGDHSSTAQYTITDSMGRSISAGTLAESGTIDVSALTTGVYLLSLQSGSQSATRRFVVTQ